MRGHCALCGAPITFQTSHNPEPLGEFDDRVCGACNHAFVIPARLGAFTLAQVAALRSITASWAQPTP